VVSAAQVWSAAAQNIAIVAVLGYLLIIGKLSIELGIPALLAVGGIDLLSRFKMKGTAAAALATGATGLLHKLPHLLVVLSAAASLLHGCAVL
jgi:hypothetical protein